MYHIARNILLAVLLLQHLCTPVAASERSQFPGKVVVVDPGHGGHYDGAVQNGVREADVNLTVSLKLQRELAAMGFKVVLTRNSDVTVAPPGVPLSSDLQARVDIANSVDADIFISLHANSDPGDQNNSGIICFYGAGRPDALASAIQHSLVQETKAADGGIRPANFYVLRNSKIPAVLVEMGFLTNNREARLLTENAYQDTIVTGIGKGITNYFLSRSFVDKE